MDLDDTIVAVASATAGAPRGVIRISGQQVRQVATALLAEPLAGDWPTRPTAIPVTLQLPEQRTLPARWMVWPGTRSFTCQPTVEIHTLGSAPLLELVVAQAREAGARLAEPGEFTLRAFMAGRIDLTQAEAVLGVIDATGEAELQTSLKQLAGGLATPLAELREELLLLLADLEAGLDFADEDIEFIAADVLVAQLEVVHQQVAHLARQVEARKLDTARPQVVLVGPVNAGKSSLFNALAERFGTSPHRTRAIESPERGVTRDYLTVEVRLAGVDCLLVDTAGIETIAELSPASEAQSMTTIAREAADMLLVCSDASEAGEAPLPVGENVLPVVTKVDQGGPALHGLATSARTGEGLELLATTVGERLASEDSDLVPSTAQRSAASLQAAEKAIATAQQLAELGGAEELVATELRLALDELGQVAGVVYTDDVLDRVFSRFCIGK
ncbi:tRNA modification GTPase [Aeoliella mucimassa]|uniref:tRNA modification GTPase MnmE n=1 Tax=Aeoliella mucimassa TaxID=2527972 RepID=A0A518ASW7_9BACT|nr:GTPase [Aeoliella mucimassa]QDU57787.1 tRNA modification GTPase MnmE [Aeoliella mucimassa]